MGQSKKSSVICCAPGFFGHHFGTVQMGVAARLSGTAGILVQVEHPAGVVDEALGRAFFLGAAFQVADGLVVDLVAQGLGQPLHDRRPSAGPGRGPSCLMDFLSSLRAMPSPWSSRPRWSAAGRVPSRQRMKALTSSATMLWPSAASCCLPARFSSTTSFRSSMS